MSPSIACDGYYLNFDGAHIRVCNITCIAYVDGFTYVQDINGDKYRCQGNWINEVTDLLEGIGLDSGLMDLNRKLCNEIIGG